MMTREKTCVLEKQSGPRVESARAPLYLQDNACDCEDRNCLTHFDAPAAKLAPDAVAPAFERPFASAVSAEIVRVEEHA
jgi:hypothetical protein